MDYEVALRVIRSSSCSLPHAFSNPHETSPALPSLMETVFLLPFLVLA